jgi:hypothetical protein
MCVLRHRPELEYRYRDCGSRDAVPVNLNRQNIEMAIGYTVGGKMKGNSRPSGPPTRSTVRGPTGSHFAFQDLAGIYVPWYLWSRSFVRSRALLMALLRGSDMGNLVIRFLKKPLGRCQSHALAYRCWL